MAAPIGRDGFTGPGFLGPVGVPGVPTGAGATGAAIGVATAMKQQLADFEQGLHIELADAPVVSSTTATVASYGSDSIVFHVGSFADVLLLLVALIVVLTMRLHSVAKPRKRP